MDSKSKRNQENLHHMTGEITSSPGSISPEQLQEGLLERQQNGSRLGQVIMSHNILNEAQLRSKPDIGEAFPRLKLANMNIDEAAVKMLPLPIIRMNQVLPISRTESTITLAMSDPMDYQVIHNVQMATGLQVVPVLADEKEIQTALRHFMSFQVAPDLEKILGELDASGQRPSLTGREKTVIHWDEDAPVIRIVNSLLAQAVQAGCSDMHIEAQETAIRIRFRIDGELQDALSLPLRFMPAIVSRIKIMAGMDISEKRIPQDGRFRTVLEGREVDFRVSTLPTYHGEKAALRILDFSQAQVHINRLGLSDRNQDRFCSLIRSHFGMVLVTGSTGSGKTTTLYSILKQVSTTGKNIITLEDPIEYTLSGINQVQVNNKAGLTFVSGLGSILRQDPDIIMVGEIRDRETARLATQAALTGHLVFSTLHTNSAVGTVARLVDMGIEKFLLATSLAGVISQRLVRRLCEHCRKPYCLDRTTAVNMGMGQYAGRDYYQPKGCNMCRHSGYEGRIALQEIMMVGPKVRAAIARGAAINELEAAVWAEGMVSIKEDGLAKAHQGLTSLEEVMKAVYLEG